MISAVLVWTVATLAVGLVLWMFAIRWIPQKAGGSSFLASPPLPSPPREGKPRSAGDADPFASLELEALSDSKVSTIEPTVGERLSSADITLLMSNTNAVIVERAWVAIPGSSGAKLHLEVNGTPLELDAEGRCVKTKPLMRPNGRWHIALSHSWVPKGPSVAESDEQIPVIVTLELADESGIERKSIRILCHLAPPRENRLYLEAASRPLMQRVFERNVASMHLLKA